MFVEKKQKNRKTGKLSLILPGMTASAFSRSTKNTPKYLHA
jgi:hypothetical protein